MQFAMGVSDAITASFLFLCVCYGMSRFFEWTILKIHIIAALLACASTPVLAVADESPPIFPPIVAEALPEVSVGAAPKKNAPLDIALTVQKIVLRDGKEQRIDAGNAVPGDVLEYRAEYKNVGMTALTKVLATLPLPEHTTLVIGSAYPGEVAISTKDSKDVFVPLVQNTQKTKKVTPENKTAEASADAPNALRWAIEKLAPGQMAVVGMRVRVNGSASSELQISPSVVQVKPSISQ